MTRRIAIGTVVIAVVMLIVGLVGVGYVNRLLQTQAQDELFRQAEATGRLVEGALADVGRNPGAGFEGQLRKVRSEAASVLERARVVGGHDVVEAMLVTPTRSYPLSLRQDLMPLLPPDLEEREALSIEVDGTELLSTVQRFPIGASEIVIAIGRTAPLLPIRGMSRALMLAVVVGVVMIVISGVGLARWVRERLTGLETASRQIAEGDLSARAPVNGDDAIATVSVAFNDMAANLQATHQREREFLMSIGHDLRTPLTTIRGYAEALDDGTIGNDDTERVAAVLHTQTDRLTRLVEDVMLLARLEAREFTLRPESTDVTAHLSGVVDAYRVRAGELGVALEFTSTGSAMANIDPDRLDQVCSNLIENALRYTPEHGTVTVTVEADVDQGSVRLIVGDTGPGIEPSDADRVFDRLYVQQRYHPIRPEGSGLGLTIVRELVDAMGGTVRVDSTPGEGAQFIVELAA
ncbi:MAG: HAMP domain-containing sensor histidine kinase [Acidimicrobiia bacterium]